MQKPDLKKMETVECIDKNKLIKIYINTCIVPNTDTYIDKCDNQYSDNSRHHSIESIDTILYNVNGNDSGTII